MSQCPLLWFSVSINLLASLIWLRSFYRYRKMRDQMMDEIEAMELRYQRVVQRALDQDLTQHDFERGT